MARERILVVEDEADLREVLVYNLRREGYRTDATGKGREALALAKEILPDLILLDLMLPDIDGLEVCRRLKQQPATAELPVIMVTAKGEETDVVLGLGLGAEDYVKKPFGVKELLARVQAALRRPRQAAEGEEPPIRRGPIEIFPSRHEIRLNGVPIEMTASEFRLLKVLAGRPGRVYTRGELLAKALGDDVIRIERNIDVHVRAIRKKLGNAREMIETIRGVGYRFRDAMP